MRHVRRWWLNATGDENRTAHTNQDENRNIFVVCVLNRSAQHIEQIFLQTHTHTYAYISVGSHFCGLVSIVIIWRSCCGIDWQVTRLPGWKMAQPTGSRVMACGWVWYVGVCVCGIVVVYVFFRRMPREPARTNGTDCFGGCAVSLPRCWVTRLWWQTRSTGVI